MCETLVFQKKKWWPTTLDWTHRELLEISVNGVIPADLRFRNGRCEFPMAGLSANRCSCGT